MAVRRQPIPFGKYYLLDRINIGGMAEVWRAKTFGEQGFEKLVAIKRILPNIAEDDEFITMFIDEAKITVQLTHANVAQVFDLGKIGDSYFIAMEYVAGKDLRAIFDRSRKKGEPAPIPMVAFMVSKMCEGLDYAHRKKDSAGRDLHIVHRDVSPQNCLVSFEGEIKVIDFGIAKAANKATKTQAGILKGKFGYMSPEQVRGLPLDQRSDVFAAGVVLYEMLTGERLFVGDSDFSVLEKVRQVDILPPTKYNRRIPEGLEKIVLKALAKDPEERFQWASDLADALQRFLILNDTIFSRKDLSQYLKSTFAEDVEKEKVRQAEYAEIKLPPGMAVAAGMGASPAPGRATSSRPGAAAPAGRSPAPPPLPPAMEPPSHSEPTAPAMSDRTVIDGNDAFADSPAVSGAPRPQPPPRRTTSTPPPPRPPSAPLQPEGGVDELIAQAEALPPAPPAGRGNGASPRPSQREIPQAQQPATPPPRAPVGRPLPPNLGEPVRPPAPIIEKRAPGVGAQGGYKPRLPELEKVSPAPANLLKWGLIGGGGLLLLVAVAAIVTVLVVGGTGSLIADYEPADAQVFLDGVEVCSSSPCAVNDVKVGKRRLEVRKHRYETALQVVEIVRGQAYQVSPRIKLKPLVATIPVVIASDPADAQVKLDGAEVKALGRAGIWSGELKVGVPHQVEVSKPGYASWKKTLTPSVSDKPPINEFAQLTRQPMVIRFASTPANAKVLVDDKARGNTPLTLEDLDPGANHSVVIQKACYKEATATILAGSPSRDIDVKLEKRPNCP